MKTTNSPISPISAPSARWLLHLATSEFIHNVTVMLFDLILLMSILDIYYYMYYLSNIPLYPSLYFTLPPPPRPGAEGADIGDIGELVKTPGIERQR